MKRSIFLVCVLLTTLLSAQESTLNWRTDFEAAKKEAKKEKKNIFMYFTGSDWCTPCILLKEDFFDTLQFAALAEELVLLEVDIPRKTDVISPAQFAANKKLVSQYNASGGFPTIVVINHKGKVLGSEGSYSSSLRDPSRYFAFTKKMIAK